MDTIDIQILHLLNDNGRMSASEISRKVNLSVPAVSERIKKLEDNQLIEKYSIQMNRVKLEFKLLAFIFVTLIHNYPIDKFRKELVLFEEVLECHHTAGEYDYLLKVLVEDTTALEDFLTNKLKKMKEVEKTNSLIILSTQKEIHNRIP